MVKIELKLTASSIRGQEYKTEDFNVKIVLPSEVNQTELVTSKGTVSYIEDVRGWGKPVDQKLIDWLAYWLVADLAGRDDSSGGNTKNERDVQGEDTEYSEKCNVRGLLEILDSRLLRFRYENR